MSHDHHHHHKPTLPDDEVTTLGPLQKRLLAGSLAVAGLGVVIALVGALASDHGWQRFFSAYLTSYAFWLSLALGSLFFVLIQHLTKAAWSVTLRRLPELAAATLPMMALLFVPVAIGMLAFDLYPWSHGDETLAAGKALWLSPGFFLVRFVIYFLVWGGMATWLWRFTGKFDAAPGADDATILRVQRLAAPGVLLFATSLALGAFDLLMTLQPHWYSTMFGVYYFAGCFVGAIALMILMAITLQRAGRLTGTIGLAHYHDLGKWLFAFVFFWGYIAFSQFMLIWYGNIPEETVYYIQRGASGAEGHETVWMWASLALLVCHFLIPFAGLIGRWAKMRKPLLVFWALWILVMHFVDLLWIVRPALVIDHHPLPLAAGDALCALGLMLALGGAFFATMAHLARSRELVARLDPRLSDALAFEQPV